MGWGCFASFEDGKVMTLLHNTATYLMLLNSHLKCLGSNLCYVSPMRDMILFKT